MIQRLFQVHATDLDLNENGWITYSILPPYDYLFEINDQGEVFTLDSLNQSSFYPIRIMANDHGQPNHFNSIEKEKNLTLIEQKKNGRTLFLHDHWFIYIILLLITISLSFCFHNFIFNQRKKLQSKWSNVVWIIGFNEWTHFS